MHKSVEIHFFISTSTYSNTECIPIGIHTEVLKIIFKVLLIFDGFDSEEGIVCCRCRYAFVNKGDFNSIPCYIRCYIIYYYYYKIFLLSVQNACEIFNFYDPPSLIHDHLFQHKTKFLLRIRLRLCIIIHRKKVHI